MSTSILSLIMIREKIIKEVGDLSNIEEYPYKDNSFTTEEGWKVGVIFNHIEHDDYEMFGVPSHVLKAISIAYNIEGVESQFQKSNYKILIKILKTVTSIIINYIKSHPEVQAIVILPSNKEEEKIQIKSDPQKHLIYKSILTYQTSALGWTLKDFNIEDFDGFVLYKKEPDTNKKQIMKEISILEDIKLLIEAEGGNESPRLKLDVNPNPTKKGVKVQFILPKGWDEGRKEELTQKLKTKLNTGLAPHMLSVDVDMDVPYENVIGFLISLGTIKMLVKSALEGKPTE